MAEFHADHTRPEPNADPTGLAIPMWLTVALIVALLTLLGTGTRYYVQGDLHPVHSLLGLFFSANLWICGKPGSAGARCSPTSSRSILPG